MNFGMKNIARTALRILFAVLLLCMVSVSASAERKTGGEYEVMFDVVGSGEIATSTSFDYGLYSVFGQPAGYEMISGGINQVNGGFLGVIDETPPTILFTSPTAFSTRNNSIPVVGTAFDENYIQWTLYYGPGESPTVWKQLAASDSIMIDTSFATWDASSLHGPYTLRVVAVDSRGNTATGTVTFNVGNTVTMSGTIPQFKWVMVSLPMNPSPSDPISMYGRTQQYKIYRWNPEKAPVDYFNQYEYPSILSAGNAFWIFSFYQPLPYSYNGTPTDTTKDFVMDLKPGWNQIGTPFDRDYSWEAVRVQGAAPGCELECPLSVAAANGLLSRTLFEYNGDARTWLQQPDPPVTMTSRTGYFLRTYGNIRLLFSPNEGIPGGLARIVRTPFDYRVRLSASVNSAADVDNYLGVTRSATTGFDSYDAEEPPRSPDEKYVSLYFPHNDWARLNGRYANDVRDIPAADGQTDKWTFVVETNATGETPTLKWDGAMPTERYAFRLIHEETGRNIDMASSNSYSLPPAAAGTVSNHFRVEVTKLSSQQFTKRYRLRKGWNLVSMPIEPEITSAQAQLGDNLNALNVYQLFDGNFYAADKADIQAGLGYWIFVENDTDIDITGRASASEVRVPLKPGWNLIGDPYESDVAWSDGIAFVCNEIKSTLSHATASGVTDGKLFEYDGTNYTPAKLISPWKGYALKMNSACDIVLAP